MYVLDKVKRGNTENKINQVVLPADWLFVEAPTQFLEGKQEGRAKQRAMGER